MERNKLQLPLLTHIALLFILAALVATIGVWLFSRRYWIESAAEQSGRQAKSAALLARMALADTDPDFLTQEDEEMREDMHQIFRNLCKEIDLTYLYLFTVSDNIDLALGEDSKLVHADLRANLLDDTYSGIEEHNTDNNIFF